MIFTIPADLTSGNGFFDWLFHNADVSLFGNVGIMMIVLIAVIFGILMIFNANRFTVIGFIASLLIGLGYFGYTIVGWIAPLGALIAGLLLGIAVISILRI